MFIGGDALHSFELMHLIVDTCPTLFTHSPMIRHVVIVLELLQY